MRISDSYVTTVDPLSAADMEKLWAIRQSVKIFNRGNGHKKYVKLHGRGPRVKFAKMDGISKYRYQQTLPVRYAERLDVYIYERRS